MSSSATAGVAPPVARRSEEGSDPYHWLRTTDPSGAVSEDSEIYSYLKAENAYTEAMTSNLQPLQDVIFAEFKKRIRENDQTPPARDGPYSYYFKYQEGKQYKIYCRSSSHFPPPSSTSPSSSSSSSSSTSSTSSTSSSSLSPSIYSDDLIKHLPFQRFDGTGRVFGGARPTGEQVEKYVTELNISTIVTLLEDSEMTEELHAAYGKLQHEGRAKQLRLPLRAGQAPENKRATQELLREIGAQLREGRHVWVHCSDGTQRTGLLLALLGITIDQQPLDQVGPWLQSHLPAAGHALGDHADFLASFPIEQEEIVLDVNALAADGGHEFIDVRAVSYSPDHRKIVFSQDTSGSESYLLFIKDLASGRIYSEEAIPGADGGNLEWSNDSTKLFYTLLDEQNQPNRVLCHTLGQPVADDVLFWQEHNQEFYVTLSKTRSNAFIVISTSSAETSESWLIDADSASLASLRLVQPRQEGLLYDVTHHPNPWPQSQLEPAQQQAPSNPSTLLVLTNAHSAVDFQLMWCPVDHTTIEHWRPLLPHKPARRLLCISSFRNHLVLRVRENAIMQVQILPLPLPAALRLTSASSSHDAGVEATAEGVLPTIQTIEWGSEIYKCTLGTNHEFDTEWLQVLFKTPITPNQYFEVKLSDPSSRWVIKTDDLPCGYDSSRYEAKRLWVPSSRDEGVLIPVSIMQPKHRGPGPHPCILYGYGSYEISIDAEFDRKWLSFFDRGYTFAIAHVRGGGEMGRAWYENGKKKLKVNTFYDFIDVANALIAQGITAPEKMTAIGRSAGGLLMGAIQNMAPQLFRVIVADVPFLDCLNTMLDPTIPLTVLEYQEWGNPQLPEYYQVIRDYAPYEQLDLSRSEGPQPIMLVQAGLKDKRVCYWEPAKYVAKYRHLHRLQRAERHAYQQPFQILLKTDLGAGHFSKTGRYDLLKEYAFEYAFILSQLTPEVLQSTK